LLVRNLGDSQVDEVVIDEGLAMVWTFWDVGVAHRDVKPANLPVQDGHLQLVDVSALEVRPSPWRQAVDLSNMLLTAGAALGTLLLVGLFLDSLRAGLT
jgi:tRNA A-37 threonylcarbamoyl transferase component Bud32